MRAEAGVLRRGSPHRRLLPFYFSYAAGLIVPVVLGAVLFLQTSTLAERNIDARLRFTLVPAAVDIESILREVEYTVTQASSSGLPSKLADTGFKTDCPRQQTLIQLLFNPVFLRMSSFSRFITDFFPCGGGRSSCLSDCALEIEVREARAHQVDPGHDSSCPLACPRYLRSSRSL